MNQLNISVVIPTHNGARWIDAVLRSAIEQSYAPAEVIVVDDGSTDGTTDIVERWVRGGGVGNIRLVRRTQASGGPAVPLNVGFDIAQSPYVAICEQDDLMCSERLAQQVECFHIAGDVGLVSSYATIENYEKSDQPMVYETSMDLLALQALEVAPAFYRVKGSRAYEMIVSPGQPWFMRSLSGCMVPKAVWDALGGFDEGYKICTDMDFILRVFKQFDIAVIAQPLYRFRLFADHLGLKQKLRAGEEMYQIWKAELRSAAKPLRKSLQARSIAACLNLAFEYRRRMEWGKSLVWFLRYCTEGGSLWKAVKGVSKLAILATRLPFVAQDIAD